MILLIIGLGKLKKYCFAIIVYIYGNHSWFVDTNIFLCILSKRMITVSNTKWLNILYGSDRYDIYRMFKRIIYKEPYLNVIDRITNRKTLTFFRLGVSSILIHRSRFSTNALPVCPLCNGHEEVEMHFLLHCPVYYDSRQKYLCVPENVSPNYALFKMVMERNEPLMIHKLSLFIYYALTRRNDYISGTVIENI